MTAIRIRMRLVSLCFVLIWFAGLGALTGCGKPRGAAQPFVVQVGDSIVSTNDWARELQKRPNLTPEQRESLLQELIRNEALYIKARESGFDKDPEMTERVKRMIASAYWEKLKGPEGRVAHSVEELQEYYAAHSKEFAVAERAHISGILLRIPQKATEEKKKEHQERADGILARAQSVQNSPVAFGELAREFSEDQASRYQGGDLGWFTRQEAEARWGKEAGDAIFALKQPRDLSQVVPVAGGLIIFRLIERQPPRVKSIDEVRDLLVYRLSREKETTATRALEESVRSGLKIEINRSLADQIAAAASTNAATTPPSMPQ